MRLVTMGIIPAAGAGSRTQPLAFAKELLPLGARVEDRVARPRAVSEYLIERLILGGADRLCFVIGPDRSDLMSYYGGRVAGLPVCYVVQPKPVGLCDARFCATAFLGPARNALVGMPGHDLVPGTHALHDLPEDVLSFVLLLVARPELFDAVLLDARGDVRAMEVKSGRPAISWIWGGFRAPAQTLRELAAPLELARDRDSTTALGTLVSSLRRRGGRAVGVRSGRAYVDVRHALTAIARPCTSCTPRPTSKPRSPTGRSSRARPTGGDEIHRPRAQRGFAARSGAGARDTGPELDARLRRGAPGARDPFRVPN